MTMTEVHKLPYKLQSENLPEVAAVYFIVNDLVGNSQLSQEQIIDLQDRGYRVTNEGYFKIKQLNNNKI
ncbi:MAG: hypothetical protein ABR980_13990 [Ignavibacteriaceae bacterium]